MGLINSI